MNGVKRVLSIPGIPLVLLLTGGWFAGSTYWYICQTQQLCNNNPVSSVIATSGERSNDKIEKSEEPETTEETNSKAMEEKKESEVAMKKEELEQSAADFDTSRDVTVYFTANRADFVDTRWQDDLDEFVEFLKQNLDKSVRISGYAATADNSVDENVLSRNRAKTVAEYMIDKGVKPNQIRILVKAYKDAINDNSTSQLKALNRRAVVTFSN